MCTPPIIPRGRSAHNSAQQTDQLKKIPFTTAAPPLRGIRGGTRTAENPSTGVEPGARRRKGRHCCRPFRLPDLWICAACEARRRLISFRRQPKIKPRGSVFGVFRPPRPGVCTPEGTRLRPRQPARIPKKRSFPTPLAAVVTTTVFGFPGKGYANHQADRALSPDTMDACSLDPSDIRSASIARSVVPLRLRGSSHKAVT